MLRITRRSAVHGAAVFAGWFAAVKAQVGTSLSAGADASWDGRWSGAFGARSDLVISISGGKVAAATLLGQPLTVTASSVTPTAVSVSGPDFSLTMTRQTATAAQAVYTNNRKERASALMSRR